MTYWVLILIVGRVPSDYPNVSEHTFYQKTACTEMLKRLKAQRPDVSGTCVANRDDRYQSIRISTVPFQF